MDIVIMNDQSHLALYMALNFEDLATTLCNTNTVIVPYTSPPSTVDAALFQQEATPRSK
jgi:hypothetical protein